MQPPRTTGSARANAGAVLVIEDHPLYRDALVFMLGAILDGSKIVAASSVEEGLPSAANIPDLRLVLLDVTLPGLSGTEAVTAVRSAYPKATLIVVSASEDRRDAVAALRAGAQLFISKSVGTDVLAGIIRSLTAGELPAQPTWIPACGEATFIEQSLPTLPPRQRQILALLSHGYSNKEISLRLGVAEVTVKMHVSCLFRTFGVANRTQAVLAARRFGVRDIPEPAS